MKASKQLNEALDMLPGIEAVAGGFSIEPSTVGMKSVAIVLGCAKAAGANVRFRIEGDGDRDQLADVILRAIERGILSGLLVARLQASKNGS
jgi:hypothetical protein